jgi:hypothetical protein
LFAFLGLEAAHKDVHLLATQRLRESNEEIGRAQVAIILGNLVFQNHVVPETVPRKFTNQAMVLMQVAAAMSENQIRSERPLQYLEGIFDPSALEREIAIPKILEDDPRSSGGPQEKLRRFRRLPFSLRCGTEDHPIKFQTGMLLLQSEKSAPAADFNVIAMRAQTKHSAQRLLFVANSKTKHCDRSGALAMIS